MCDRRNLRLVGVLVVLASGLLGLASPRPVAAQSDDAWVKALLEAQARHAAHWQQILEGVAFGPWHSIDGKDFAALGEDFSFAEAVDFSASSPSGVRLWQTQPEWVDGQMQYDLGDANPNHRYVCRMVSSPTPSSIPVWLGAMEGLEILLNGEVVYTNKELGNGFYPEPDMVRLDLPLRAGKNSLALRTLGKRWGGFYFAPAPQTTVFAEPWDDVFARLDALNPAATDALREDLTREQLLSWFRGDGVQPALNRLKSEMAAALGEHSEALRAPLSDKRDRDATALLELYAAAAPVRAAWRNIEGVDFAALRRAIADLEATHGDGYPGEDFLSRLELHENAIPRLTAALEQGEPGAFAAAADLAAFKREVLLANPLLDFDGLLVVKRRPFGDPRRSEAHRGLGEYTGMPRQSSYQNHRITQPYGWENEIAVLAHRDGAMRTLYRPRPAKLVSDLELHWDARKLMFSMPDANRHWQIFEMGIEGDAPRQISPADQKDVHNFDSCYLPDDRIAFISTAPFQGVPCNASIIVGMTYTMNGDGTNIRQLSFDQDHNYYPSVMNDGRILYLRWEYTDIPHVWARYLFTMNPDGSNQREYYGSGSYWPNSVFFARAVPDHPTKVVGIVTGHHIGREGELVVFDPGEGRLPPSGVVQRIPGYGKPVEPVIEDKLTEFQWPKFVHPYPLSQHYFLVSCKPSPKDLWGIYLVDVFDNMVLLKEVEDYALFEPMPLEKRTRPPIIVDRVDLSQDSAILYMEDVYKGRGLEDVPRGSVKELRIYTYHFGFQYLAGIGDRVGADGPWEPKRVLGTVPVREDGSAMFHVPANMPLSIQPLDASGAALQLMRSWTTAMPGEVASCVGCHEEQNVAPPASQTIAARNLPSSIRPWKGPVRGFSFKREVQPVLDKYCVGCHNQGGAAPNLSRDQDAYYAYVKGNPELKLIQNASAEELTPKYAGVFQPSYIALRRLTRVGGLESDIRVLNPGEFHVNTTELFQMLRKGHHGVELDAEAWDRLTVWVDLNAPCHGTWQETVGVARTTNDDQRRRELRALYGAAYENPESYADAPASPVDPVMPAPRPRPELAPVQLASWPLGPDEARARQATVGRVRRTVPLGNGVEMELALVPAGEYVMGSVTGEYDEFPPHAVRIERPFWMGTTEVTNAQYACFDTDHDSRFEHRGSWIFSEEYLGWPLNEPEQPVVRISWQDAMAFCAWLSERTGEAVSLPTEAQWEYACRAGSSGDFYYGTLDADFSKFANLADERIREMAYDTWDPFPPDLVPRVAQYNDGALVTAAVGSYAPNAWGLHDMHGNAWEWTRSAYRPYPYAAEDGRNDLGFGEERVVRGGSWYDRPHRARAAYRLSYPAWQKVYNVGFRVVVESAATSPVLAQARE